MRTSRSTYRWGVLVALGTALFLVWAIGALGVLAYEGYRGDMMYLGVLAVGVVGVLLARFRPAGMAVALCVTALAQGLVAGIALVAGMAEQPGTSVLEIVGVNGMFVALFGLSAWLFRRAARQRVVVA